jgi:hypothetical protein
MKAFINQRTTLSFFVSLVFWALLTGSFLLAASMLLLSLLFFGFNPINVLLFVLIGLASMADIRQRASQFDNDPSYFQVPAKVKYRYLAFYMALVLVLLVVILSVPSLASVMQAG